MVAGVKLQAGVDLFQRVGGIATLHRQPCQRPPGGIAAVTAPGRFVIAIPCSSFIALPFQRAAKQHTGFAIARIFIQTMGAK